MYGRGWATFHLVYIYIAVSLLLIIGKHIGGLYIRKNINNSGAYFDIKILIFGSRASIFSKKNGQIFGRFVTDFVFAQKNI